MRAFLVAGVVLAVSGCAGVRAGGGESSGSAPLRGFGVQVDQAVSARVPVVHLRTCGSWGCHEQDVPLAISGPTSALPCDSGPRPPEAACGIAHLPGPGPGYGYAPVPGLTLEAVTVTVTTPAGAPLAIRATVRVQPRLVCPDGPAADVDRREGTDPPTAAATCAGGAPQAQLRIAADATVSQSR